MQLGLLALGLAATLYNRRQSFAEYYGELIRSNNIHYKFFDRRDVVLYDESLTGDERQAAKSAGIEKRDRVMAFLDDVTGRVAKGAPLESVAAEFNAVKPADAPAFPAPKLARSVGDGALLEFDSFWFVIRASGTDAVLRYYIEGEEKPQVETILKALIDLKV
jgi:phosphomannomutase